MVHLIRIREGAIDTSSKVREGTVGKCDVGK